MFPAAMAIGFHYVDYVVHGWDVARTLGQSYELPFDVVAAALPLALVVPDGDFRTIDNAPFGPAISSTEPADDLDQHTYLSRPLAAVASDHRAGGRRGGRPPLVVVTAGDRR